MKRGKEIKLFIETLIFIFLVTGCKKNDSAIAPTLTTTAITDIKTTSATSGGNISNDGGSAIIARGVCWSLSTSPVVSPSSTNDGSEIGTYSSSLTGLSPNTTYFVRAYAKNKIGVSYGDVVSFKTIEYPYLSVSGINILSNKSISCDIAINNGGGTIIESGVCWDINASPTMEGSHINVPTDGSISNVSINNLLNNTTYHIRGYAINEGGIGYGVERTFTTYNLSETGTVTDIDNNTYNTIKIGTQIWMQENLKVTHYQNGDAIPNVPDQTEWNSKTTGALCWYNNDETTNKNKYGALYNFYTAVDSRKLCPTGWHVPSKDEFDILVNYFGGIYAAGFKMEDLSNGFNALLGGTRQEGFEGIRGEGFWWSSSIFSGNDGISINLMSGNDDVLYFAFGNEYGRSIRCIKD